VNLTLRAARVNAGLTIAEASAKIGCSVAALRKWETGANAPNAKYIPLISDAYHIPAKNILFF